MINRDGITYVEAGWAALKKASWETAKTQFKTALTTTDNPEVHDGLGLALWWLGCNK
jgi:hypothetical protein